MQTTTNDSLMQVPSDQFVSIEKEETNTGMHIEFSPDTLKESLPIMGKGMLGIFIVIGVIILIVYALNAAFKPRKKKAEQ